MTKNTNTPVADISAAIAAQEANVPAYVRLVKNANAEEARGNNHILRGQSLMVAAFIMATKDGSLSMDDSDADIVTNVTERAFGSRPEKPEHMNHKHARIQKAWDAQKQRVARGLANYRLMMKASDHAKAKAYYDETTKFIMIPARGFVTDKAAIRQHEATPNMLPKFIAMDGDEYVIVVSKKGGKNGAVQLHRFSANWAQLAKAHKAREVSRNALKNWAGKVKKEGLELLASPLKVNADGLQALKNTLADLLNRVNEVDALRASKGKQVDAIATAAAKSA